MVPTSAAQFPGSFASELRQDHRKYPRSTDWRSVLFIFFLEGWTDISTWKSAFIEFVGSTSLCYISAMAHTTIGNMNTQQAAGYVGISNIFIIMLFIYALAPSSGGHINPMITFTTMLAGLTSFPRTILYLIAQTSGAALAGGLIRGSFGPKLTQVYHGGGCFLNSSLITEAQVYLIESMLCFCAVFLSFGVGLDPRQAKVFGPRLGPFLVACILGLIGFASVGIVDGYPGAGVNPARCFAFAVARGDFSHQWIWWAGPLTGSLVQTVVYHVAPPYHRQMALERAASSVHLQSQEQNISKV